MSLIAVAVPDAKSSTPTAGLVTVPITPLPNPETSPCKERQLKLLRIVLNTIKSVDRSEFQTGYDNLGWRLFV